MIIAKAALLSSIFVATVTPTFAADTKPIPIGVVQVLSGPQSKYGANANKGIELAADEINKAGGVNGRAVKLFVEDTAGNKDQAINAVRKVIGQDKVVLVIGPTLSTEVFAATPLANKRGVSSLALTATAPGVAAIGEYSFRMALPEDKLIPASVHRAKQLYKVSRGAILFANDDANMKDGSEIFKKAAAKNDIEIVATEAFGSKDVDFSAQLTKIAALNVDVVMVSAYPDAGASILTQARRLGLGKNVRFIGGNGFNSPKLIELAGAAAEGTIVSGPWSIDKQDDANKAFIVAYKAKFGELPDQFVAQGYDGMKLVAEALKGVENIDRTTVKNALMRVKFSGVMGPFSFDKDREPAQSDGAVTFEVTNGVFKIVQ